MLVYTSLTKTLPYMHLGHNGTCKGELSCSKTMPDVEKYQRRGTHVGILTNTREAVMRMHA